MKTIFENDTWVVKRGKSNTLSISYFEDFHFVDDIVISLDEEEDHDKTFLVVFWNRFGQQTQTYQVKAKNAFRAGRMFYRKHSRKSYHDCIDVIQEIR